MKNCPYCNDRVRKAVENIVRRACWSEGLTVEENTQAALKEWDHFLWENKLKEPAESRSHPEDSHSSALSSRESIKLSVYAWLGFWRDQMPAQAVTDLQEALGPLDGGVRAVQESQSSPEVTPEATFSHGGPISPVQ